MKKVLLLAIVLNLVTFGADVPGWVREMESKATPKYPAQTPAVVLWNEERNVVEESGRRQISIRKAIRVLTPEGRRRAIGGISFEGTKSKVTEAKAWIIQPTGKSREIARKEFAEGQATTFELFDSHRYLTIDASREVDPGAIFAYELTIETRSVFSQFGFSFQNDLPQLVSRLQVTAPPGWTTMVKGYQGATTESTTPAPTYTWEMRNLPPVEREPASPRLSSIVPRIAVTLLPPSGQSSGALAAFPDWKEVSVWKSKLADPQVVVNSAVEEKAKALVAGRTAVVDKMQALAEFAQGIRYVAVSINTSMGGGYTPRRSDEVLAKAYGDCKDKSNLLRALLRSQGIESYPVSIYSGDPRYTREDWPSPHQFNHAILAIRTGELLPMPAAFSHPVFGPMILFDPTDPHVPFGYLPDHEQGSHALLMAGGQGGLFVTPETTPAQNQTRRQWKLTLDANGGLSGEMEEISTGQDAFDRLEQEKALSAEKWRDAYSALMSQSVTGAKISKLTGAYDAAQKTYRLSIQFEAASYARVMKEKLWMVRSVPVSFNGLPNVNRSKRELPLVLPSLSFIESIEWKLPEDLKLDELPEGGKMETGFGKLESHWKAEAGKVAVTRTAEVRPMVIDTPGYREAREFIGRFHGAEAAPIVLLKK